MTVLIIALIGIVVLMLAVATFGVNNTEDLGCEDDIPCQECGQCYGDHINRTSYDGHAYVYPRDLHR